MVPKPFRKSSDTNTTKNVKSKDWNPATFFIIIFLFIGSMSIQQIALKKSFETFTRQSDVRIGLLREVIGKLQKGEKVDVEKVLGTGDAQKEVEWQQGRSQGQIRTRPKDKTDSTVVVIEELEKEDAARSQKKKQAELSPPSKPKGSEPVRMEEIPQAVEQPTRPSRATFF
jgi:hypothetical protein